MISNTATPKYYGEFREKVLNGEIPVCEEISMQMNRIDELIANPQFYYDDEAIDGFIDFCEAEMTTAEGDDLILLPSFKLWAEDLFSWFYFEKRTVYEPYKDRAGGRYIQKKIKRRLRNKQYLIVARSAAKSMYLAFVQAYELTVDRTTTDQVTTAPTMRQANEVVAPIQTAIIRHKGPLFKFLTQGSVNNTTGSRASRVKLASTKKGIQNFLTNSIIEVYPMSVDKLQGLKTKVVTVDEWLSCDTREDIIGAVEQGAAKIKDYIIVAASSEGTIRNSVGDTIKMELMDILKGKYYNPHTSIWYYKLDDISEVPKPETWLKANPNLGLTVDYDTYQRDVERAENAPATRNDILAKRFGLPMEGYSYFFTYEETLRHSHKEFWGMSCSMGMDASLGDDFYAFTFLFPLENTTSTELQRFGVKTRCYISSLTLSKLPGSLRVKYNEFIDEGSLAVMEGSILDTQEIYEDIDDFIQVNEYSVECLGYDPYNAKEFVNRWSLENGEFATEKVIQGMKTESVPLGELKKLAGERALLFDESLVEFAMGNAIVEEDTNGNRKLLKRRREEKIDSVSAMMDALVAYKLHKDMF